MHNNTLKDNSSLYTTILKIDLSCLKKNYRQLLKKVKPAILGAVVKSDAYGLGAKKVATVLYGAGCRFFFVAHPLEGVELRNTIPSDAKIIVLNGLLPGTAAFYQKNNLIPTLNQPQEITEWAQHASKQNTKLDAFIQIDTGMHRLGLTKTNLNSFFSFKQFSMHINFLYCISHLSESEIKSSYQNMNQLHDFEIRSKEFFPQIPISLSNSGGIFLNPTFYKDMVRSGLALYGISPDNSSCCLKPVIEVKTRILQITHVDANQRIGYSGTFKTKRPSLIATLGIGYADGLRRSLSNKGYFYWRNKPVAIVGNISMDLTTIDITDCMKKPPQIGDFIELIGKNQSCANLAQIAETIPYEILTSLKQMRAQRLYQL